jgi:hypothetical protein
MAAFFLGDVGRSAIRLASESASRKGVAKKNSEGERGQAAGDSASGEGDVIVRTVPRGLGTAFLS